MLCTKLQINFFDNIKFAKRKSEHSTFVSKHWRIDRWRDYYFKRRLPKKSIIVECETKKHLLIFKRYLISNIFLYEKKTSWKWSIICSTLLDTNLLKFLFFYNIMISEFISASLLLFLFFLKFDTSQIHDWNLFECDYNTSRKLANSKFKTRLKFTLCSIIHCRI